MPNHPRYSKHTLIHAKDFPLGRFPLSKMWSPFESVAAWQPVWRGYQLIHTFNSIPFTQKPWIATFEDILPRLAAESTGAKALLREHLKQCLAASNCKRLIAISDYARVKFSALLSDWSLLSSTLEKLVVIHPNFPVLATQPKTYQADQPLRLLFIGRHFARKGGIVVLRLAQKAQKLKLPIEVHIISQLRYGPKVPTDFPDQERYAEDLKLLNLPNVVLHGQVSNQEVLQLLSQSHFQVLATLHDTYGYSVLEGFSTATPAITTNVCALPEVVHDQKNGYLLNLPLSATRQWADWSYYAPTSAYWDVLNQTYETLAEQALKHLSTFFERSDRQEHYAAMSAGALNQAQTVHDSKKLSQVLDKLYSTVIETAA